MRFRTGLETPMKTLVIAAALLLTASAAQAGANYSFEIGGRTVRLHAPRGCDSPSCISISIPGVYDSQRKDFDDDDSDVRDAPQATALPAAPAPASAPEISPANATRPAPAIVTPTPVQQSAAPLAASIPPGDAAPPAHPHAVPYSGGHDRCHRHASRGTDPDAPAAGRRTSRTTRHVDNGKEGRTRPDRGMRLLPLRIFGGFPHQARTRKKF